MPSVIEHRPVVLYVDAQQANLEDFRGALGSDYVVKGGHSAKEALELLDKNGEKYAILIIVDPKAPEINGIELCEKVAVLRPEMIRIILTASTEPQLFLDAINRAHVHHFLLKPWKKEELKSVLDQALREYGEKISKREELEIRANKDASLESDIRQLYDSGAIIGEESGLKQEMEVIKKVAPTDSSILVLGETGTGKELLARAIHDRSRRRNFPFVPVHCASLVETLMESELFGYEKGSFTGADQMHRGRFEIAKGGTIFLDEIGELPEDIQVKLLRVLQEKEIYRVGGNKPIAVDVRMIAATHRNLEEMVRKGKFREDLFYRLNVIMIRVPSLRDRKEDLSRLALHFLKKYCRNTGKYLSFSTESLDYLARYDWPGNIRELQNVIERAAILSEGSTIDPDDLNLNIEQTLRVEQVDLNQVKTNLDVKSRIRDEEIHKLSELLMKTKGNITAAAKVMGIPRATLYHRLRKYRLI